MTYGTLSLLQGHACTRKCKCHAYALLQAGGGGGGANIVLPLPPIAPSRSTTLTLAGRPPSEQEERRNMARVGKKTWGELLLTKRPPGHLTATISNPFVTRTAASLQARTMCAVLQQLALMMNPSSCLATFTVPPDTLESGTGSLWAKERTEAIYLQTLRTWWRSCGSTSKKWVFIRGGLKRGMVVQNVVERFFFTRMRHTSTNGFRRRLAPVQEDATCKPLDHQALHASWRSCVLIV